ncbi:Calx-beta domain-containing protein [Sunxiuqinia sp. A32]|uniref:Calx-beta domain-containing protein n=1 Tax=Sunxiuqinia sp. A32 TaxID=3461496 RepID=UPI0040464AE2
MANYIYKTIRLLLILATILVGSFTVSHSQTLSIDDVSNDEGNTLQFTVTLNPAHTEIVTVNYATQINSASASDFSIVSGTLTFSIGETAKTIDVNTTIDSKYETNETFFVNLSDESANASITDPQGIGTINNDDNQPAISINDDSKEEGNSLNFTVSLSNESYQTITVDYKTTDVSATAGDDYTTIPTTTLTFAEGETTKNFSVTTTDDSDVESSETFTVDLSNESNASFGDNQGLGTITDNDVAATPAASINDVSVTEAGNLTFTVTLDASPASPVSLQYATDNQSATTADNDYTAIPLTTLDFGIGEVTKQIVVATTDDDKFEPNETMLVNLSNESGITISDSQGIGTINNDDNQPAISINDDSKEEGNSLNFTVSLSNESYQTITVDYKTTDVSATAGDDYTTIPTTTLTFAEGETTKNFSVTTTDDSDVESSETFTVDLSNELNASFGDNQGLGTITDNDVAATPAASINDVSVTEAGNLTFTVTLDASPASPVSLQYATDNQSATTADNDYTAIPLTTLDFGIGEVTKQIVVATTDDDKFEPNETMLVNLSNESGITITDTQGIGTINNDDIKPTISINDDTKVEGNSLNFTVSLSNESYETITVDYKTTDVSATAGDDYTAIPTTTLTFTEGQTTKNFSVTTADDSDVESSETFTLDLSNESNASFGDNQGVGTITDNDVAATPAASIDDVSVTEAGNLTFTVTLDASPASPVSLQYATDNQSATTADNDYTAIPLTTLDFGIGEVTKQIVVATTDDDKFEPNETMLVNLSNESGITISDSQGIGTINNDDNQPAISINDDTKVEGNSLNFTVSLSNESYQTVTVDYKTTDVSATAGDDYTAIPTTTLTFTEGQTTKNFSVTTADDSDVESSETFTVDLSNESNASFGDNQGVGTITDNDVALPQISINNPSVDEGGNLVFTVTLDISPTSPVSVQYKTTDQTAKVSDLDYTEQTLSTLNFGVGQSSKTITVNTITDSKYESNETLAVDLSNPTGATIADNQGIGTINNDDPLPSISISDLSAEEGNTFIFSVTLSNPSDQTISVNYTTADGTATVTGNDYTQITSTPLTFLTGETSKNISVATNDDGLYENDETFKVNLSSASNATLSVTQATGTIQDNDTAPEFSISDPTIDEGGTLLFTVSLNVSPTEAVSVQYQSADQTATLADLDYTKKSLTTLYFAIGETSKTISVATTEDTKYEANETMVINITNASKGIISKAQGVGTINNDDNLPSISIADDSELEGNSLEFSVTLSNISYQTINVTYATANGTATTADSDYNPKSATVLTFAPGESTKSISVTTTGDSYYEPDETFVVNLTSPVNSSINNSQATGTIANDDPQPKISISDDSKIEGNSLSFNVSISARSYQTISVNYEINDGTATVSGSDYTDDSGSIQFLAGETSKTITVATNDDNINEPSETFTVDLSTPTNATLDDGQGMGTIIDNDGEPSIFIGDASSEEGESVDFTVSLSNGSSQSISVNYQTANQTAEITDSDYTGVATTVLTFAPGETVKTISINTTEDTRYEEDETFLINLSGAVNATISDNQGTGTITNDDPIPSITINDDSADEGTILNFTVSLSNSSYQTISVDYSTVIGTATLSDFTAVSSATIEFAPGETSKNININTTPDKLWEVNEIFTVVLSNASNATIAVGIGLATILNNDNRPIVNDIYKSGNEDSQVTFSTTDFTSQFSDADGDNLQKIKVESLPENGSLRLNGSSITANSEIDTGDLSKLSFTPNNQWSGETQFDWNGSDGTNYALFSAQVILNIGSVNDSPRAENDVVKSQEDMPATGNVLDNDSDPDGDQLTVTGYTIESAEYLPETTVTIENIGNVAIQSNGNFQFTPVDNYYGEVPIIQYTIADADNKTSNATLSISVISVNDSPDAIDDSESILEDTQLTGNVLENDFDVEGDELVVTSFEVESTSYNPGLNATLDNIGSITINQDGSFTFSPLLNFNGDVPAINYTIEDPDKSNDTAVLSITVIAQSEETVAVDDQFTTAKNTAVQGNVIENDMDGDGGNNLTVGTTLITNPSHGNVVMNANGSFTYSPDTDYSGEDQFEYEACNSANSCDQATVTITIIVENQAPVAADDEYILNINETLNVSVIANDSDPDGDQIQISTTAVTEPINGQLTINPDGTISYLPNVDFLGTDSFDYEICDNGDPSKCDNATVTITVMEIIPIAVHDAATTAINLPIDIPVADNDSSSFDPATLQIIENPANGIATIESFGIVTYTPNTSFIGYDSFIYEICDSNNHCDTAIVRITIGDEDSLLPKQVFTPNGDGQNDTYVIEGIENYPNNKFIVFNRWGNVVYEKSGYMNEWTGESNSSITVGNNPLPVGTYFYVLEYNAEKRITGFIYIDR